LRTRAGAPFAFTPMSRATRTQIAVEWMKSRLEAPTMRPTGSWLFTELHRRYSNPAHYMGLLKAQMQAFNVSQGMLAERSGFDPPRVSRWLRMKVRPTLETMVILDETMDRITRGE
jgi:hypothetical protein